MSDQHTLRTQLRALVPDTEVYVSWKNADETVYEQGTICNYDPTTMFRHIETDDRTLLLSPTADETTVSEITATGPTRLGALNSITYNNRPTEPLRVTNAGIDVPSYLVGYTGQLLVSSGKRQELCHIAEPPLERYDARLFAELDAVLPSNWHETTLVIRPLGGPRRKYELIDDRRVDEYTPEQQQYTILETVIVTVRELSEAVYADTRLDTRTSTRIERKLFALQSQLLDIHQALFEPAPSEHPLEADDADTYSWTSYTDAIEWLETQLEEVRNRIEADNTFARERLRSTPLGPTVFISLEEIQQTLDEYPDQPPAECSLSTAKTVENQ
ncbi:hypothetical protein [Natronorubrum tibetense]|uniref:Uncharacterized protein n=1 Tax=Natronorubrum tibetense GA33 TaxID=1114856 RepID=L9VL29_9EURY|nr:hypothetical protein [Natronorubrum tibetense]ELY37667.1 hypothetical protein C496_19205 [Natronorubrum tibetense GA33]